MPIRPPEFEHVVEALEPVLRDFPGKLVAIDGRDGAGKTTLGRFLAWYFNVTLVESSLFLVEGQGLTFQLESLGTLIARRLTKPLPIIVEGVAVLHLLSQLHRAPDFHIYVRNKSFDGSEALQESLRSYEQTYRPSEVANLLLQVSHNDG